jgi:hypothetical protein
MKVIAKTHAGYYMVEAHESELEQIAGKSINNVGGYYRNESIAIGTKFDVQKAFQHITAYNSRPREITTVRKTLEGILLQLELIEPIIQSPEESASESE